VCVGEESRGRLGCHPSQRRLPKTAVQRKQDLETTGRSQDTSENRRPDPQRGVSQSFYIQILELVTTMEVDVFIGALVYPPVQQTRLRKHTEQSSRRRRPPGSQMSRAFPQRGYITPEYGPMLCTNYWESLTEPGRLVACSYPGDWPM
jgi:hypothetical protein